MATCEWKLFVHTFHDIIYVSLKSKWFDLRVEIIEMSVICTDKSASWDISYLDYQSTCTWSTADAKKRQLLIIFMVVQCSSYYNIASKFV